VEVKSGGIIDDDNPVTKSTSLHNPFSLLYSTSQTAKMSTAISFKLNDGKQIPALAWGASLSSVLSGMKDELRADG